MSLLAAQAEFTAMDWACCMYWCTFFPFQEDIYGCVLARLIVRLNEAGTFHHINKPRLSHTNTIMLCYPRVSKKAKNSWESSQDVSFVANFNSENPISAINHRPEQDPQCAPQNTDNKIKPTGNSIGHGQEYRQEDPGNSFASCSMPPELVQSAQIGIRRRPVQG